MATPGAFANIRLHRESSLGGQGLRGSRLAWPGSDGGAAVARPYQGRITAIDLVDSFYLLAVHTICEYFALELPFTAADVGVGGCYDDRHFCHAVIVRAMVSAAILFGLTPAEARAQLLSDYDRAPNVRPGPPVLCPYVDNANALCWDDADAKKCSTCLQDVLRRWEARSPS